MSTLIYVDTNIYMNFLLDEKNEYGKPLAPSAFKLFNRTMRCEFEILISHKVTEELFKRCPIEKTTMLFELLKKKIKPIKVSEEDVEKAKALSEHYQDALHAILASKNNAKYIVTRNKKDFIQYSHLVTPVYPDEI